MTPYSIQGPTRLCTLTGRELRPGEPFYSVLTEQEGQFFRKDYAEDAWPGAPPDMIAYWRGKMPRVGQVQRPTINDELLMDCFLHRLESTEPAQQQFRYVVALLLMRRKRLKFEDVKKRDNCEYLCLKDAKTGKRYEVLDPGLNDAEMNQVQDQVFHVLGWD